MEKLEKGEYAEVREALYEDGRDTTRRRGVIVDIPKNKQGYYRLVDPYQPDETFRGHVDDIQHVPDSDLLPQEREFREEVRKRLTSDK